MKFLEKFGSQADGGRLGNAPEIRGCGKLSGQLDEERPSRGSALIARSGRICGSASIPVVTV